MLPNQPKPHSCQQQRHLSLLQECLEQIWLQVWHQPPIIYFTAAFCVPGLIITGLGLIWAFRIIICWLAVLYGCLMLAIGISRFLWLWRHPEDC